MEFREDIACHRLVMPFAQVFFGRVYPTDLTVTFKYRENDDNTFDFFIKSIVLFSLV